MTDQNQMMYGDPVNQPFWQAALEGRLVIQHCGECGHYQFYGRPFCLECQSDDVQWITAAGTAIVYSQTTVHVGWSPEVAPPYTIAIVQLDEGVRMMSQIVNGNVNIGDRVSVLWRPRDDAPPLPFFEPVEGDADE